MSLSFEVYCNGKGAGAYLFTVEDDGTIFVEDVDFELELIAEEMGFEPSPCVTLYRIYENKPLDILYDQRVISPYEFFRAAVEVVDEEPLYRKTFPKIDRDLPFYKALYDFSAKWDNRRIRPSHEVGYLHIDPEDHGGYSAKKFLTHGLWILREMAKAMLDPKGLEINTRIPQQLDNIIKHTGRAIAHSEHPTKRPIEILDERDAATEEVFGRVMKKFETFLAERDNVENF